ncbi:MAG: host attachment protein [Patescibacteria group bacterium]
MKLPRHLQHFPQSALIVTSDTVTAKFYLAGGDSLEELDGSALPKETGQDGEGSFEFFPDDAPRLHAFAKQLAAHLTKLAREHTLPSIHLIMPAEVEHLVSKKLPPDVAKNVGKKIDHDVMKESPLTIVERVLKA